MKKNILRNSIISMSLFIMPFTSFASEKFEENNQNKTHKFEDTFLDKNFDLKNIEEDHIISIKDTDLKYIGNKFLLKNFLENKNNKVRILLSKGGFVDKKGCRKMGKWNVLDPLRHLSLTVSLIATQQFLQNYKIHKKK